MGKKNKNKYYAWILPNGDSGICETWEECQKACSGWHGEKHQGFRSYEEAQKYIHPDTQEEPVYNTVSTKKRSEQILFEEIKTDIRLETKSVTQTVFEKINGDVDAYCREYGFIKLSDAQKRAVQSVEGKTLLFAVPGSGKTTVIIARAGYMIYSLGISPKDIISLTFTKAAANEMKDRFSKHFQTEVIPDFRTIHSLCYSIILPWLKRYGFQYPLHLLGEQEEKEKTDEEETHALYLPTNVIRETFKRISFAPSDFDAAMEAAQTAITGIKNTLMERADYEDKEIKINGQLICAGRLFDAYQAILKERDCMDFDDLLSYACEGLNEYKQVLDAVRARYKYWSVDEAQDNSLLQFMLLDLISGKDGNMFMVGDDDQSIYSFRGADPRLLIEFGQRPNVKTLLMGVNYRSDYEIVKAVRSFVELNNNRAQKELLPSSKIPGEIVIPRVLKTEAAQYDYIVKAAKKADSKNTLAVLYRRNISSLPLIVYLHKNGIEYKANKGIYEVLKSRHIKVIWKIMYLAMEPTSYRAFSGCHNQMGIHLSKEEKKELQRELNKQPDAEVLLVLLRKYQRNNADGSNDAAIDNLCNVINHLNAIKDMTPSAAAVTIIEKLYIIAMESISDRLRIYSLLSACDLFRSIPEFIKTLRSIQKKEQKKEKQPKDPTDFDKSTEAVSTNEKPAVTLSTMHSAKGLQFDRVIIIDSFDEIMPGRERDDALIYDPEEERRLFYVALTRAKHRVDILTVDSYHGNNEIISSFVTEFAYFSENGCDNSQILKTSVQGGEKSTTITFKPSKYYAVRVGRVPGVYTTWTECQEQIHGYPRQDYKSFEKMEEALEYAAVTSESKQLQLSFSSIEQYLVSSGGVSFNYPMDLPHNISRALYDYFGVTKLTEIEDGRLKELREASRLFEDNNETDYSSKAEAYTLVYMPVNFYKVWKPLSDLARKNALPVNCKMLELGAGPGTATLGMLYFYYLLAKDNPEVQFSLDITAVEREEEFHKLFQLLTRKALLDTPKNLTARVCFIQGDALSYAPQEDSVYDILLESNMLNANEGISEEKVRRFLQVMAKSLDQYGYTLMVEPGTTADKKQMETIANIAKKAEIASVIRKPEVKAVDIKDISICRDALAAGLRFSEKQLHWFNYMILQNGGDED